MVISKRITEGKTVVYTEAFGAAIDWSKVTPKESEIIREIVDRAVKEGLAADTISTAMDISAVHAASPLFLEKLRDAPLADFRHDILGIRSHLNRRTGRLTDCFVPRHERPSEVEG